MQAVLLSGGSGKRLWPLSNEIRSKQFLELFDDGNGGKECMLKRMYRELSDALENISVTVATDKNQISATSRHLGNDVSICAEPCRRDTFPAISLISYYLRDVKKLGNDETVVICPVDPYTDDTYFKAISELADLADKGESALCLLGIEPSYPSEKYGYIIPKENASVASVTGFKEKPGAAEAERLLSKGALWNAGVFACKLGWLAEKAKGTGYENYESLYENYADVKPVSFDIAVCEKEKNITVMRYAGEWRDVGTWNTITEVMEENAMGNVTFGEDCENTHAINDLDIPLLCLGLRDVVVAAGPDGILVSDKHRSSYMKPYVEKISMQPRYAEKSWGEYRVVDQTTDSLTIRINLKAGNKMKYHCHTYRDEVWTIISGEGIVLTDGKACKVSAGDVVEIPKGVKHSLIAVSDINAVEVQIGSDIQASDKEVFDMPDINM